MLAIGLLLLAAFSIRVALVRLLPNDAPQDGLLYDQMATNREAEVFPRFVTFRVISWIVLIHRLNDDPRSHTNQHERSCTTKLPLPNQPVIRVLETAHQAKLQLLQNGS